MNLMYHLNVMSNPSPDSYAWMECGTTRGQTRVSIPPKVNQSTMCVRLRVEDAGGRCLSNAEHATNVHMLKTFEAGSLRAQGERGRA